MAGGTIPQTEGGPVRQIATALGLVSLALGASAFFAPARSARAVGLPGRTLLLRAIGTRELASGFGLFLDAEDRPSWLWGRVAGDAFDLASLLVLARGAAWPRARLAAAAVGGIALIDTAASLFAERPEGHRQTVITRRITIGRPPVELIDLLAEPGTMVRLAGAGAHATNAADGSSHWSVSGPGRRSAVWTMARAERAGDVLRWAARRDDGAPLRTLTATFAETTRGTVVSLELQLARTGAGRLASPLLAGRLATALIDTALHRFKALAETGEIPTIDHQPAARADTR